MKTKMNTGLPGLDEMLQGLIPGDNVVWLVDSIEDYLPFIRPYLAGAIREGRKVIYFRFARHAELIAPDQGVEYHRLQPEEGFERFLTEILNVIEKAGPEAFYVFDWLSDLAVDWYSDRMLGNFFMITCPYLYDLDTIAYFGLRKNQHSFHATDGIFNTAQVILEVYRKKDQLYLHPHKVFQRYSPTLYTLHQWQGDSFLPVTSSATITEILSNVPHPWLDFSIHRPGVWTRTFRQAQETWNSVKSGRKPLAEGELFFRRLLKMLLTRDERFIRLAEKYFELGDLIEIMKRMVGTGLIGGKSLGMLLARAILKKSDPQWNERLEVHDSFYIGSDVFYTYLVQNGCWWLRRRQKDITEFLEQAEECRQKMLQGVFPQYIQDQFKEMLAYFGQSPIIVRSSSLLEDNYGNAFSGKYESVFCANQGTPAERLEALMNAVRTVYSSTMSREGLLYRLHHSLLDCDEQMALLVQRVSGEMYGTLFFPQLAGVGFSFNPFVWNEAIDPKAGVLRMVLGLGTRAVDRTEDDYTRIVALNVPTKRLESDFKGMRQYAQRRLEVLDLKANQLAVKNFEEIVDLLPPPQLEMFATCDEDLRQSLIAANRPSNIPWMLTFEKLLAETPFGPHLRELLRTLQDAYEYPVDVEFTTNFLPDGRYRINLLQCRPFQVKIKGEGSRVQFPVSLARSQVLLESRGPIVGHSLSTKIDRLIYVVPSIYGHLPMTKRYSVARAIGKLTHLDRGGTRPAIMIVGPGRWGTSMPSLGIPVSFAEINTVAVAAEIAVMHEGLVPDVSLGTHFFNDLVEMDMLYLAVFPERENYYLNEAFFQKTENHLARLLPGAAELEDAVKVVETGGSEMHLNVDSLAQRALLYLEEPAA